MRDVIRPLFFQHFGDLGLAEYGIAGDDLAR